MSWRDLPDPVGESEITAEHTADVVVVGLGYAGSAAARAAAEAGASVIGIESAAEERFHPFGLDFGHINSEFLRSRGVPAVDPVDLFNEWMKRAGNRANPELVMKFCQNSGAAFDWYTDMYTVGELGEVRVAFWPEGGARHKAAAAKGDPSVNGFKSWIGTAQFPELRTRPGFPTLQDVVRANLAAAEARGAELVFGCSAEQPVMDGRRAAGILAKNAQGEYIRLLAKKGVILCAGDFSGNLEMVADLCCDIVDMLPAGEKLRPNPGRRGRGQQLGVWAGGKLESRPLPTMGGNIIVLSGPCSFGSLYLNSEGRRFCNEIFGGTELSGMAGNQMPRDRFSIVFDEHWLENEAEWAFPCHMGFDANQQGSVDEVKKLVAEGKTTPDGRLRSIKQPPLNTPAEIYCGNTPEELVANAGLTGEEAKNVIASIRRYNELCAKGRDDDFGRDARTLDPLTGMLFLQKTKPVQFGQMLVSVGGLVTDGNQQVLGEGYLPIEGLFASGNCCGRRFGSQYATPIAGVSIGIAVTLGREAGRYAAGL